MFIKSLFPFPKIEVKATDDFHYIICMPIKTFERLELQILRVFFKYVSTILLICHKKRKDEMCLYVAWRHIDDEPVFPEDK